MSSPWELPTAVVNTIYDDRRGWFPHASPTPKEGSTPVPITYANLVELDEQAAGQIKPGDTVLIQGTVLEALPGAGVRIELFSKTDQYDAWIRLDHVAALVMPDVPAEPADGTWLVGNNDDTISGGVNVFHRDDVAAPAEPERRWQRRWQTAGTGEWLDWPTAYHRGACLARQLRDAEPTLPEELHGLAAAINEYLGHAHAGARTVGYIGRTMRQLRFDVTDGQVRQVTDWMLAHHQIEVMPHRTDQAHPLDRYQLTPRPVPDPGTP